MGSLEFGFSCHFMPNPLFVVKLGNWAILNDCMLGGMLNKGLIMFSWQHDIQSPKNTVACKYETFFLWKKKDGRGM